MPGRDHDHLPLPESANRPKTLVARGPSLADAELQQPGAKGAIRSLAGVGMATLSVRLTSRNADHRDYMGAAAISRLAILGCRDRDRGGPCFALQRPPTSTALGSVAMMLSTASTASATDGVAFTTPTMMSIGFSDRSQRRA